MSWLLLIIVVIVVLVPGRRAAVTRTARILAALILALPLLTVSPPAQASFFCSSASYPPEFHPTWQIFIRGNGSIGCSGQEVTGMGIRVVLQRYYLSIHHWQDMTTLTSSGWHRRDSSGSIGPYTVSLACLNGRKISYRTRTRWYVDDWYGGSGTNSLYSGYKTMECGR